MIRLQCRNCGQKLKVSDQKAGKKGRCPNCKNTIVIPKLQDKAPSNSPENSPYDLTLLDVPEKDEVSTQPAQEKYEQEKYLEEMYGNRAGRKTYKAEQTGKRRRTWIIDIFLYPTSKAGLKTLGIITGIKLLITLIVKLFGILATGFPPFLAFLAFFAISGFLIRIVLYLYFYWYFCECVQDSALGGIRAPETMGITPGLGEILWPLLRAVICLSFFLAPAIIYFRYTKNIDSILWSLLGYAVFFFPMGLLAIIMFDSFTGLNPIVLVGSILSTFLQYLGLVLFYYALCSTPILIIVLLQQGILPRSSILLFFFDLTNMYIALIGSHILGRFYWRYQEKLNWDV